MLLLLSMESLAGSGYRAGGNRGRWCAWRPFGIPVTHGTQGSRLRNIVPETLGFEGSETAGRHGHVNQLFPEDQGETQRLCNGNGFETDIVLLSF